MKRSDLTRNELRALAQHFQIPISAVNDNAINSLSGAWVLLRFRIVTLGQRIATALFGD